jgi:uncharacterized protein YjbI with pentapeptide repeats
LPSAPPPGFDGERKFPGVGSGNTGSAGRFSDRDLGGLDPSELGFRGANLAAANLTAAALIDANLSRSNLVRARLDRAVVIRANFAGTDLPRTSLVWLVDFSGSRGRPDEAPNFAGTDLPGVRSFARLSRSDLNRAHLANARIASDEWTPKTMKLFRTERLGCNLSRADLAGADLSGALLSFADLSEATLSGANLYRAELSHADLTNGDLTPATLSNADFEGAILRNVRGLAQAIGWRTRGAVPRPSSGDRDRSSRRVGRKTVLMCCLAAFAALKVCSCASPVLAVDVSGSVDADRFRLQ